MPPFERVRERYLDDAAYSSLQDLLLLEPELGDLITVYDKNEMTNLAKEQKDKMKELLEAELRRRAFN